MPESFWIGCWLISALLVIYPYALYPLLIVLAARLRPHPIARGPVQGRCTVIISAYNEKDRLPGKIRALIQSSDMALIDRILIGSDGSTDGTVEAVRGIHHSAIAVYEFKTRRGKPSVLNDLVAHAGSDFLVMTDARQTIEEGAIRSLLENFSDQRVGIISGELVFRADSGGGDPAGMRRYWDFEKLIRSHESRFRSVPGVTGAFYAMRRSVWQNVPTMAILDDLWIPMQVIGQGLRCAFDRRARVFDHPSSSFGSESIRKRRTLAGVIQCIRLMPSVLRPHRNPIWWEFMSHKVARFGVPFGLMGLTVISLITPVPEGEWGLFWWISRGGFVLTVLSGLFHRFSQGGCVSLPWRFAQMNAVVLFALWDGLAGRLSVAWRKSG